MLEYKMDIVKVAQNYTLDTSKKRAEFLHLICDDIFYRFVYHEGLEKWPPQQVKQAMYDDYDFVTAYILKKYNFQLPENLKHLASEREGKSEFFSPKAIDRFVDVLSGVNLEKAQKEITTNLDVFRKNIMASLRKEKTTSKQCFFCLVSTYFYLFFNSASTSIKFSSFMTCAGWGALS